jgi:hypothetical protein
MQKALCYTARMKREYMVVAGVSIFAIVVVGAVVGWRSCRAHEDPSLAASAPRVRSTAILQPGAVQPQTDTHTPPMLDEDPPGMLRLEGQVVDADGQGVTGATVVLAANPTRCYRRSPCHPMRLHGRLRVDRRWGAPARLDIENAGHDLAERGARAAQRPLSSPTRIEVAAIRGRRATPVSS